MAQMKKKEVCLPHSPPPTPSLQKDGRAWSPRGGKVVVGKVGRVKCRNARQQGYSRYESRRSKRKMLIDGGATRQRAPKEDSAAVREAPPSAAETYVLSVATR